MVSCHFTPFYKPFRELEEENFKRLIPHFHSQEKKFLMVYLAPLGINLDMLTLHNSYNHSTITSSIRLSFDDLFGRFDTPKRMSKSYKVYLVTVICSLQIQHDGMEEDQKICLILMPQGYFAVWLIEGSDQLPKELCSGHESRLQSLFLKGSFIKICKGMESTKGSRTCVWYTKFRNSDRMG